MMSKSSSGGSNEGAVLSFVMVLVCLALLCSQRISSIDVQLGGF